MKKCFAFLLCLMLTVLCAAPVSANSGPGHWESGPAYGMVPTKGCPITVEKEDLTFQIKQKHVNYSDLTADVTAAYHMKNPTSKPLDVEMVFPLISNYEQISVSSSVKITAAGQNIPYKLYVTGPMPNLGYQLNLFNKNGKLDTSSLPNFETMLKNAVPISGQPKYIKNDAAVLYEVKNVKNAFIKAVMTAPKGKTHIISFNCGQTDRFGDKVTLNGGPSMCRTDFSFLVIGEKPTDIKITAYDQYDHTKKLDIVPQISVSEAAPLEQCHGLMPYGWEDVSIRYLDGLLERDGICDILQARSFISENCIFLLDYKVPFAASSEQNVSVSYPAIATMDDHREYHDFTFAYLSNPAKNWASFKNLNVTVTPPGGSYDLSSSNIGLKKEEDGNYKVSLKELPQNDIAFAFSDKTPASRVQSNVLTGVFLLTFAVFLIVFVIVKFHPFKRKSKKQCDK